MQFWQVKENPNSRIKTRYFPLFRLGRIARKDTLQFSEIVGIQSEICDGVSSLTAILDRLTVVELKRSNYGTG